MQKAPPKDQALTPQTRSQGEANRGAPDPLRALGECLPASLNVLETQARAVLALTEQVRAALADEEKSHLLSATYVAGLLTLTLDSAAWSARLRFSPDELRQRVRDQGGPDFVKLRVKVGRGRGE